MWPNRRAPESQPSDKLVIDENAELVSEATKKKLDAVRNRRHAEVLDQRREDETHTRMQLLLTKLGKALGNDVLIASNDRSKFFAGEKFFSASAPCRI